MKYLNIAILLFFAAGIMAGGFAFMFVIRFIDYLEINVYWFYGISAFLLFAASILGLYYIGKHRKEIVENGYKEIIKEIGAD